MTGLSGPVFFTGSLGGQLFCHRSCSGGGSELIFKTSFRTQSPLSALKASNNVCGIRRLGIAIENCLAAYDVEGLLHCNKNTRMKIPPPQWITSETLSPQDVPIPAYWNYGLHPSPIVDIEWADANVLYALGESSGVKMIDLRESRIAASLSGPQIGGTEHTAASICCSKAGTLVLLADGRIQSLDMRLSGAGALINTIWALPFTKYDAFEMVVKDDSCFTASRHGEIYGFDLSNGMRSVWDTSMKSNAGNEPLFHIASCMTQDKYTTALQISPSPPYEFEAAALSSSSSSANNDKIGDKIDSITPASLSKRHNLTLISGHSDGSLCFWDVPSLISEQIHLQRQQQTSSSPTSSSSPSSFSTVSPTVTTHNNNDESNYHHPTSSSILVENAHSRGISDISVALREDIFATAGTDSQINLWDGVTRTKLDSAYQISTRTKLNRELMDIDDKTLFAPESKKTMMESTGIIKMALVD